MTATLTAPDLAPLLAKAAEFPEDIGPRLVLADFLEEQGDPWAEFIRVQCELERIGREKIGWSFLADGTSTDAESRALRDENPTRERLQFRERDLFARHGREWAQRVFAGVDLGIELATNQSVHFFGDCAEIVTNREGVFEAYRLFDYDWHLGLPSIFRVPTLAAWMGEACYCTTDSQFRASGMCKKCHGTGRTGGIAAALRGRVPVREVWCGDREPLKNRFREGDYFWSKGTSTLPSSLPNDVWDLLENYLSHYPVVALTSYPTPDAARLALARAVGRWTTQAI